MLQSQLIPEHSGALLASKLALAPALASYFKRNGQKRHLCDFVDDGRKAQFFQLDMTVQLINQILRFSAVFKVATTFNFTPVLKQHGSTECQHSSDMLSQCLGSAAVANSAEQCQLLSLFLAHAGHWRALCFEVFVCMVVELALKFLMRDEPIGTFLKANPD
jgi:hypothetical protein